MPRCFSIKLHSETQVSGRLGMSGGGSPRHARGQLVIPTGLYSDRSIFRQVVIPTGRYSDRPIFRQVDIPTGRYSNRSIGLF